MQNKLKLIRITTVPISFWGLLNGQLRYMNQYFDVKGVSSDGEFRKIAEQAQGVEIIPIEMKRSISPLHDLKSVWVLYKLFKKEKPFIVHTHTPKAGTVGMLAAKFAGVPHRLHTIAGLPLLETKGIKRRILNLVEKVTYSCATKIYPNSKGLYDIILDNRFTKSDKLRVIGQGSSNGVNTAHYNPTVLLPEDLSKLKSDLGIHKHDFVFIFAGRIVKDKGINELLAAFDRVSNENEYTKLILLGFFENDLDPLSTESEQILLVNKSIIHVGFQKDVRPYFGISDALAFPSYREGFPNVVMQAGAMELPSIVSNINGCNEIVVDNENGIIVPVKDVEAIYEAMIRIIDDTILFNYLKKNAREMICKRFEQKDVWNALLKEYKNLD